MPRLTPTEQRTRRYVQASCLECDWRYHLRPGDLYSTLAHERNRHEAATGHVVVVMRSTLPFVDVQVDRAR